ncbi:MAG: integrase core domain-containing protein [Solirubrobacteraceae bacterium]
MPADDRSHDVHGRQPIEVHEVRIHSLGRRAFGRSGAHSRHLPTCRRADQQTLQREWAYALEYASSAARRASLPHWVRHYNERRTHSALGNRPPIERVREVTGLNT